MRRVTSTTTKGHEEQTASPWTRKLAPGRETLVGGAERGKEEGERAASSSRLQNEERPKSQGWRKEDGRDAGRSEG